MDYLKEWQLLLRVNPDLELLETNFMIMLAWKKKKCSSVKSWINTHCGT